MKRTSQLAGLLLMLCGVIVLAESERAAVRLKLDEMLLIEGQRGTALLDFTSFGKQEGESLYRWRFVPVSGSETNGIGRVFEKYERVWKSPTECDIRDLGSELTVRAGPYEIEWSYGEAGADGWLYVHTNTLQITVLPDAGFETNKFTGDVEQDKSSVRGKPRR